MSVVISGKVRSWQGFPLAGAVLSLPGYSNITTPATGLFTFTVANGYTGWLTCAMSGITFTPSTGYTYFNRQQNATDQDFTAPFSAGSGSWWTTAQTNGWIKLRHQKRYVYLWASSSGTLKWYYRFRTIITDEWEHQGLTKAAATTIAAGYASVPANPRQSPSGTYAYASSARMQGDQWKVVRRQEVVSAWSNTGPFRDTGGYYWLEYGSTQTGQF